MKIDSNTIMRWLVALAVLAFVGSIIASMLFETMLPLVRQGDWTRFWLHVVGLPLILAGTGLIVWGGLVFVRGTFQMQADDEVQRNTQIIRERWAPDSVAAARRAQLAAFGRAWRPGLLWMAAGFALIAAGGYLTNL